MTESKEELKNLLMKVKEESGKARINLNIPKKKNEDYGLWSHLLLLLSRFSRFRLCVTP